MNAADAGSSRSQRPVMKIPAQIWKSPDQFEIRSGLRLLCCARGRAWVCARSRGPDPSKAARRELPEDRRRRSRRMPARVGRNRHNVQRTARPPMQDSVSGAHGVLQALFPLPSMPLPSTPHRRRRPLVARPTLLRPASKVGPPMAVRRRRSSAQLHRRQEGREERAA